MPATGASVKLRFFFLANGSRYHSVTVKVVALVIVPPQVVMTLFLPVVAPVGTVAVTVVSLP